MLHIYSRESSIPEENTAAAREPAMSLDRWGPQIWERLPPALNSSGVHGLERRLSHGLALASKPSAGLMFAIKMELADHPVQVAGQ